MNFRQHKEKLLKNPKVRKEYDKLEPEFQLAQSLITARLKKGWTQAELARRVGMQQPNIARLEGGTSRAFRFLTATYNVVTTEVQWRGCGNNMTSRRRGVTLTRSG